jgi:hypothetical protein
MKHLVKANVVHEVSDSAFIIACVNFQQAKADLARFFGEGVGLEQFDQVSTPVYTLVNKALRRHMAEAPARNIRAVARGERQPLHEAIASAMRGRRKFTSEDVEEGLRREGKLPESINVRNYLNTTMGTHPDLFKRIQRGVYTLNKGRRSLKTKTPKQLPPSTP